MLDVVICTVKNLFGSNSCSKKNTSYFSNDHALILIPFFLTEFFATYQNGAESSRIMILLLDVSVYSVAVYFTRCLYCKFDTTHKIYILFPYGTSVSIFRIKVLVEFSFAALVAVVLSRAAKL